MSVTKPRPGVLRYEARGTFAAAPERLWPLVADTQRLNRILGLPQIVFKTAPLSSGGSEITGEYPIGSAVVSLLCQLLPIDPTLASNATLLRYLPKWPIARWIEHPFDWEVNHLYAVTRDYVWSPLGLYPFRLFRGGAELRPTAGGGCEVIAFADITPRNPQGELLTRLALGPKASRAVIAQCRIFERYLLGQIPTPYPQLERRASPIEPAAPTNELAATSTEDTPITPSAPTSTAAEPPLPTGGDTWDALRRAGVEETLVARLRDHVERAPDEDVLEMRPFALADQWGTDRRDTLVAFLHATTAGLVHMSWKVLCPNCRISKAGFSSLADIKDQAHCETCNISFDALVDRQVEVRFTVVEAIRHVEDRRFCAGGPQNLPHVVAQAELAPNETRDITVDLTAGAYRLRSLQCAINAVVETASPNGTQPSETAEASPVPTEFTLTKEAIRPPLAPGLQLAIQRLAFLFTDLTGSTAMYQAIGQARAFRLVQDHFALLLGTITENNGALVKTIGDAIMATFPTGADAFNAALAMQREIRKLDVSDVADAVDTATLLKIGVHEGPCIAVGANDTLDYFGTTINVAARVQSEAHGGEIVITTEVHELPSVQERLRSGAFTTTQSEAHLRGVRDPVRLYRLSGAQAPAETSAAGEAAGSDRNRSAAASPV